MKKFYNIIVIVSALTVMIMSCQKAENKVFYEGGTAPVLKASTTAPQVFVQANQSNRAVDFEWTNPNYMFNTGVSSQNVSYTLEVDTTGANFTNPKRAQISMGSDLNKRFTVKELNTILNIVDLEEKIPHNVEFRIKAAIGASSVPLFSNVIKMVITPYLDVAVPLPPTGDLYLTGDATPSGWTNSPPASQKFTKTSKTEYTITIALTAGAVKFLSTPGQWQPQYGMVKDKPETLGANMGSSSDPEAISIPSAGTYKITVYFKTGKYAVVKQ